MAFSPLAGGFRRVFGQVSAAPESRTILAPAVLTRCKISAGWGGAPLRFFKPLTNPAFLPARDPRAVGSHHPRLGGTGPAPGRSRAGRGPGIGAGPGDAAGEGGPPMSRW